ncbi:hypothetical protein [Paenibacillus hubeiensis]|uniref:hypothetical protein n=1 Tax=Paenibacillus hubeiensis TaxID=3077330 RepID=UPI0031BA3257
MKTKLKTIATKLWTATKWTSMHVWNFLTSDKCTKLFTNLTLIVQFVIIIILL